MNRVRHQQNSKWKEGGSGVNQVNDGFCRERPHWKHTRQEGHVLQKAMVLQKPDFEACDFNDFDNA